MTIPQAFELALQHHRAGRLAEAEALYRQILAAQPHHADAQHHLGLIAHHLGRHDLAVEWIRQVVALHPNNAAVHSNLGEAYRMLGQLDNAVTCYRRALQLNPESPGIYSNLGLALAAQDRFDEAIAAHGRAVQLMPEDALVYYNLGTTLARQDRIDEAIAAYQQALQLRPDYPEAHNNLGLALAEQGRFDEAVAAYRRALELKPSFIDAHSNLILIALYHPSFDRVALQEEFQRWEQQHAQPLRGSIKPYDNEPNPTRRLKIGYVSPYFGDQVVGRNLMPLFRCHDRRHFEIVCYSGVLKPDGLTEEFRRHTDTWRSTLGVTDDVLAEMIRKDGVDILVDLSLHTSGNRLPVFARRPAPVQVSFAGYPESTALDAIGYRISDRYLEGGPKNAELKRKGQACLIDSFWCYDPCGAAVPVNELPAQQSGRVTFGCLNNFCKINKPVLRLWARVLKQVANSRLVLLCLAGSHRQRTIETLQENGIEAHRVEFRDLRPRRAYLELYHQLDIALDPFPYNGHTTSLDALWMGVPVISLVGEYPVSRAGLSQLSNLGLPELAAISEDDYVGLATKLAHDLPRLAKLRATLRPRMEASPLMDAPRFARQIEAAYRTVWQQWCAGRQR